jgi:hypothetical protein
MVFNRIEPNGRRIATKLILATIESDDSDMYRWDFAKPTRDGCSSRAIQVRKGKVILKLTPMFTSRPPRGQWTPSLPAVPPPGSLQM